MITEIYPFPSSVLPGVRRMQLPLLEIHFFPGSRPPTYSQNTELLFTFWLFLSFSFSCLAKASCPFAVSPRVLFTTSLHKKRNWIQTLPKTQWPHSGPPLLQACPEGRQRCYVGVGPGQVVPTGLLYLPLTWGCAFCLFRSSVLPLQDCCSRLPMSPLASKPPSFLKSFTTCGQRHCLECKPTCVTVLLKGWIHSARGI